jgi:hypothetical protein
MFRTLDLLELTGSESIRSKNPDDAEKMFVVFREISETSAAYLSGLTY